MSTPLLSRQRVFAAKAEVTSGTAVALAAADAAYNVIDPRLDEDVGENQRTGQSALSRLPSVPGARAGRMTFRTELYNAATEPAWLTTLLTACGFVASGAVYAPSTGASAAPTLTMGFYEDGLFKSIAGAMGNFTISATNETQVFIDWDFLGVLQTESDVTLITPTYPTTRPPRFAGSTITVGAFTPRISRFSVTPGNVLTLREDAGHVSGYLAACITDRNPEATLDPEATVVATRNWQSLQLAGTTEALSVAIGSGTDGTITIAAPVAQTVRKAGADRNGISINEITLRLCRSAAAGDDELTITRS